tara:strand:+ start:265 stop:669 length:405 start_codon:yes stop_codon:yes gene_type:complete
MEKNKTYWLQGYEGNCRQGAVYRSDIAAVIKLQEAHIDGNVVGIKISEKDSNKASYTIQFIVSTDDRAATNYENKKEMIKEFDDKHGTTTFVEGKLFEDEDDDDLFTDPRMKELRKDRIYEKMIPIWEKEIKDE